MTGIGTVLADDPAMTVRLESGRWQQHGCETDLRQPERIVMDSRLRTPVGASLLKQAGLTRILTIKRDPEAVEALTAAGAIVTCLPPASEGSSVDLNEALRFLAQEGVNELWVEAGPRLSGALLQAGLIDELIVYMAPRLMGDAARGLFHLPVFEQLADCIDLEFGDIRSVGEDWRLIARPVIKQDRQ